MSRIASKTTKKIDLGNGEWVEVRKSLSYDEISPLLFSKEGGDEKLNIPLLELGIVNWRILDEEGKEVPYSKERIKDLDSITFIMLKKEFLSLYIVGSETEKKNTEPSEE